MMTRSFGIDILKTVSILAMLALHTQRSLLTGECYNPFLYYSGRFCMPVFFMINGYLLLNKRDFSMKYFWKKTFNILRLLVIWGGITAIYLCIKTHNWSLMFALQNMAKSVVGHGIIPFWWAFTFVIIYMILIFAFDAIKNNINTITMFLFGACFFIDMLSLINIFGFGGYFVQSLIPQRYRMWTWLLYFCLGFYLDKNISRIKLSYISVLLIFQSAVAILYQYVLCDVFLGRINSEYCYDNFVIVIWSALMFLTIKRIEVGKYVGSIVTKLSVLSFGAFLLHMFIIDYFDLTNVVSNGWESLIMWLLLCLTCFTLTYLISKIPKADILLKY